MDQNDQLKEHKYDKKNLYSIEQIRDQNLEKNINRKEFEVVIRYYEPSSEKCMKERMILESLWPFFPFQVAKNLLRQHADFLKIFIYPPEEKVRHSNEAGAKKCLDILKEFCGHYKYSFKEVFGEEQGSHI